MATSTGQVTDEQLIERARRGDHAAFGELVDRHRAAVVRAATAALGEREEAEDVAQDAFVSAWRGLGRFRGDATFRTWMLTIAWRHALSRRRALVRRGWFRLPGRLDVADPRGEASDPPSPDTSLEQRLLDEEFSRAVHRAVRSLTPRLRDPLMLAAAGEYSMEDIAAMLGKPVGTVKWRISEARRLARTKLERLTGSPA
jgi:RNA polymerase sigma-70 factor (ECF subfamily)